MTEPGQRAERRRTPATATQELLVTVLLVVAAVATSWSSYQATRWNGEQALASSRTNALRIEAATLASRADAETEVDVATFIAWADADLRGEDDLAEFYVERFRPEFTAAFDAWRATDPLTNPDAPPTPFAMSEYVVDAQVQADEVAEEVELSSAEVRRNIQRASNYVLTVVLYAVVLFFAGMSTKLGNVRLRRFTITAGYVLMAAALVWVATFPVSVKV